MKFDIFFSICQTKVDGLIPPEKQMWEQFFDQLKLADTLGFGTAWIAETHLSCQIQKSNPSAVIPYFEGEIGLNTDIFQLAHKIFAVTKRIHVGSAIRNILCNGGPIANAESLKTFASLHALDPGESRKLFLGFAAGRFPFSNEPYGIKPRNDLEKKCWNVLKGHVFRQATEIFMRGLLSQPFSSSDISPMVLTKQDFRDLKDWEQILEENKKVGYGFESQQLFIPSFWTFEKIGVLPFEAPLSCVQLVIGSHDPVSQEIANRFFPTWVFNLSITPEAAIEDIHARMAKEFHVDGGPWCRDFLPRTALVFINGDEELSKDQQRAKAKIAATKALENYWKAMEGTLDSKKIEQAVQNAIFGNPEDVARQIREKYHPQDRLMLWFDFNNHNNIAIKKSMDVFWNQTRPLLIH